MNIQALEQALQAIEKAWELDYITSEVLPAIQAIRQEITKLKQNQNEISE